MNTLIKELEKIQNNNNKLDVYYNLNMTDVFNANEIADLLIENKTPTATQLLIHGNIYTNTLSNKTIDIARILNKLAQHYDEVHYHFSENVNEPVEFLQILEMLKRLTVDNVQIFEE